MTLKVRIEKADATDFIADVREEYWNAETKQWVSNENMRSNLVYPGDVTDLTLWEGKRLVITESGSNGMIYTNRNDFHVWINRAIAAEKKLGELQSVKEEQ